MRKVSRITGIKSKQGHSGPLWLVSLSESYECDHRVAIKEETTIIYRDITRGVPARDEAGLRESRTEPALVWQIDLSSQLLFRYSALTFNAHRIHYDRDYTRDVEHYPNLLTHGPLQATILVNALQSLLTGRVRQFRCRALRPLFSDQTCEAVASCVTDGPLNGHIRDADGNVTMHGEVQ